MYKLKNVKNPVWIIMYSATYNNIAGWMVGVTFGYLYYLYKDVQVFTKKVPTMNLAENKCTFPFF